MSNANDFGVIADPKQIQPIKVDMNTVEQAHKEMQKIMEANLTAEQLVTATYISIFFRLMDDLIEKSGHEPFMHKIHPSQDLSVMMRFGRAEKIEDVYKALQHFYPDVIKTHDKKKLNYLRSAVEVGMTLAKRYAEAIEKHQWTQSGTVTINGEPQPEIEEKTDKERT